MENGKVWLRHVWVVLLVALSLIGRSSYSADSQTPEQVAGAKVVTAEETKRLMAEGALLVDTRVGNEFAESHILGAINVPYREKSAKTIQFDASLDRFDLGKLPADRSKPVIFYCNAGDCWKSYKATTLAVRAGFSRVYWFRGGYPEWKAKRFPVD